MPKDCEAALEQIDREKYTIHLLKGYKTILCYGAAFFEKSCIIKYSKIRNETVPRDRFSIIGRFIDV